MDVKLIDFKATDDVILNGFITKNDSSKVIIATHGMGSNCFKPRERIIAQNAVENNIDFFVYNNRGSEIVKTVKKEKNGKVEKIISGTTYEDVLELGYKEIYLQGHSLGSTKTVYTYGKLMQENDEILKYIKGIVLLSLVDIPRVLKVYLQEKYNTFLEFAENKEKNHDIYDIMPKESFIYPISVKTFLRYTKYCNEINFAQYSNSSFEFKELNQIKIPLFMRWGNVNEMIEQDAKDLTNMLNKKIVNTRKDIDFIDGADHGYTGKEYILSNQIINFIKNISI
jgi:hypothetical protein